MSVMSRRGMLKEAIKRDIVLAGLKKGDAIASERDLATRYKHSRATIRLVLQELVDEGFLTKQDRRGTFVNEISAADVNVPNREKKIIGVLLSKLQAVFASRLVRSLDDRSMRHGYNIVVSGHNESIERANEQIERFAEQGVAGIIYLPIAHDNFQQVNSEIVENIKRLNIPLSIIDRYVGGSMADTVVSDNFDGVYRATQHLIDKGHRRIAFLSSITCSSVEDRILGYRKCMMDNGILVPDDWVVRFKLLVGEEVDKATQTILNIEPKVTAVITLYDAIAMWLWTNFEKTGIRVPEDIALVGYDNNVEKTGGENVLTSTFQPLEEEAQMAIEMLIERIQGNNPDPRFITLKSTFVPGKSSDFERNG